MFGIKYLTAQKRIFSKKTLELLLEVHYDVQSGLQNRCKNVFLRFFISVTFFTFFKTFIFSKPFLFLKNVGKVQSGKQINKKHFKNNSNEIQWVHK